jgi:hypothetical protein
MISLPTLPLLALLAVATGPASGAGFASAGASGAPPEPFAVIELYTSEGCSSCPPADRLLSTIAAEAGHDHRNVMTLEFHVDYWNSPAWRDSFSDASYSERQRGYATVLRSELYTPQAVINGRHACVGSDSGTLRRAVADALTRTPRASIALEARRENGAFAIGYRVRGAPPGALMCAALTESNFRTRVRGGENAGRELTHDGVVRALLCAPLDPGGTGEVRLRDDGGAIHPRHAIVLIQDPNSLEVLAASSIAL